MNKEQKKVLSKCAQQLGRIESELSDIVSTIEDIKDSEETKLYNLPESFRYSSMGETIEEGVERLDEVLDYIENHEYSDAASLLDEF